jgi:hypothetical protein
MKIDLLFSFFSFIINAERQVTAVHKTSAKEIALGGVFAALAVVIMCLGGLIPIATFVCPMLCMVILQLIRKLCGNRIAWAWYAAVAILSVLLGPDKEAAAVFVFLGYYPIIKPKMDRLKPSWIWKGIYFNGVILLLYRLLIYLFGMDQVAAEYRELGTVLTAVLLLLGNLCFFLFDRVLTRFGSRRKRRG